MKIRTLVMALAAFSFMLTGCGNNQAKQEQNDDNNKQEVVEQQTQEESQEEEEFFVGEIGNILGVWEKKPLSGAAVNGKTDIERFAYVFCKEYSNFEPNQVFLDYLKDPKGFNNENYSVDDHKNNGYIKSMGRFEVACEMSGCYWNRDNGHKLVAFWMEKGDEIDPTFAESLLVFYDYDPATDKMTPEPALTNSVNLAMVQFDNYSVVLPDKGKDIEIVGHKIDYENDSAENTYFLYRWNGNNFNLERSKESKE